MKIKFWGTRGSLPAPLTTAQVRGKIVQALAAAHSQTLPTGEAELTAWVDQHLPFPVRATCGGNTSCVQISTGGPDYVLLDAGTGIRDFAQQYRLDHTRQSHPSFPIGVKFHLFLSHLHWDHVQGLPFFYPLYASGQEVIVYGGHDNLESAVRQQFQAPFFPVAYEYLKAQITYRQLKPGETYEIAGLKVNLWEQKHPGRSFGYRLEGGGRSVVYSTDSEHKQADLTAPDYSLLRAYADADLLIFDAMYSVEEATYGKADWGHSCNVTGVELAARARVKRLALFHHDPHHDDAEMNELLFSTRMYSELFHQEKGRRLNGVNKYPTEVLLACDGLELEL